MGVWVYTKQKIQILIHYFILTSSGNYSFILIISFYISFVCLSYYSSLYFFFSFSNSCSYFSRKSSYSSVIPQSKKNYLVFLNASCFFLILSSISGCILFFIANIFIYSFSDNSDSCSDSLYNSLCFLEYFGSLEIG
jgi:hypothetical protein